MWKTKRGNHTCLAKHMVTMRDSYVGRILDTRFEVTKSILNSVSFDTKMENNLHDMEVVVPFSFGEDIHDKIRTSKCNNFGRSGGDLIKEEEKASIGWEDKEINKNSLSSKDKVESGVYVPSWPPKKLGERETDEVDTTTTASCVTTSICENINSTITNNLEHWKGPTIVRMENVRTETSTYRSRGK